MNDDRIGFCILMVFIIACLQTCQTCRLGDIRSQLDRALVVDAGAKKAPVRRDLPIQPVVDAGHWEVGPLVPHNPVVPVDGGVDAADR